MELNITRYFQDNDSYYMSNSIANLGNNAAQITWNNSLSASDGKLLDTEVKRVNAREWIRDFGAWDDEEINAYSQKELEAFILQYVASEINTILSFYENDYDDGDDILSLVEIINTITHDTDYDNYLSGCVFVDEDCKNIYCYIE